MGAKEPGQSFLDKIFRKKDDNVTDEIKNIVQEGHQQGELLDSEAEMILIGINFLRNIKIIMINKRRICKHCISSFLVLRRFPFWLSCLF